MLRSVRKANHLYASADCALEREEYGPVERDEFRREAIETLAAALARSESEPLSLDVGTPLHRDQSRAQSREVGL